MVDYREFSHCALNYNGIVLDNYLDNYMTINVEGRQLFSPDLNLIKVPGRNGDIVMSKNYPSRDIKVHYLMRADKNEEWLQQTKRLNMLLQSNDDVRFYFDDELGVRYGQLFEFEDPPYDRNEGIGTFTIHCQDPFLYSEVKTCSGKIPDLNYDFYDVKIERIEVTIKANTSKLVIRNITRGLSIILNGNFKTGDQVVVTPDTIAVNNQNRMAWLDYVESNYHDFVVFSEDEITTTPSQYLTIKYRERVL